MKHENLVAGAGIFVLLAGLFAYLRRRKEPEAPALPGPEAPAPGKPRVAVKPDLVGPVKARAMAAALPKPGGDKSAGYMLAAVRDGTYEPITWTPVKVGDLTVEVMNDAMKAKVKDVVLRLPQTYAENIETARIMASKGIDVIVPDQEIADAMFAQASYQGHNEDQPVPTMDTLDASVKWNRAVDAQYAGKDQRLLVGPSKYWLIDRDVEGYLPPGPPNKPSPYPPAPRAVNYGDWGRDKKPIQTVGRRHNQAHSDYSQTVTLVKRYAVDAQGNKVDLLDWMEKKGVPPEVTAPWRNAPAAVAGTDEVDSPAEA